MANRSILRQSSLGPDSLGGTRSAHETEGDWHAEDAPPVQEIPSGSSERTGEASSNAIPASMLDVALALVLNEIAHQARWITNATGSAVLLIRGGVPVCHSISGATARDASAYLSECSGIAWRNCAPQPCDDVETDSRFDLASCRRLGIRSFLIVPVLDDKKAALAIVQIFSARPRAFSDRDRLALQGLGRHIVDHIEAAERTLASIPKITGNTDREIVPGKKTLSRFALRFNTAKLAILRGHRDLTLGGLIIVLAILLGWTIGRSERMSARQNRGASAAPVSNQTQIVVTPAKPNSTSVVPVANQTTASDSSSTDAPEVDAKAEQSPSESESHRNHVKSRHSVVSKSMPSDGSSSELVIFDSGKQVFPMKSPQSQLLSDAPPNSEQKRARPKSKDQETPVSVSEDVAEEHLLNRIEPDYPEYAREQRLQGTVILNVNVGKEGTVRSLSRVAGDTQLALLAAKAVRQWRFAPLVRDGAPVSFESQVTLSFALP
jgi:TonB family protein